MLPSARGGGTWTRITKGHISALPDKKHLSQSYTRFIVGFCLKNMVLIISMMNVGGAEQRLVAEAVYLVRLPRGLCTPPTPL